MTPSLATRLRAIAARRPADAVELHIIAVMVARMERTLDEITADAAEHATLDAWRAVVRPRLMVIKGGETK
jgi:hypothetical protein